ncbi:hypothetical protein OSCT_0920 [Oscillochloris trichoides DG-6]|uniref:Uncharacterized protein n=1 Tax=Oscillochloris trichoides DG-6 TaxID=765420 RepID=E1IC69_9CHLR|nr:hypothetical protein [Oscillochloris trichoides]EFO81186.1 hypothetical protein OSCT_0920 [Oscillochloris trichoides DG-6]
MTQQPALTPDMDRAERIGYEVKAIRDLGYTCDVQQDREGLHYITVNLRRDTMEGPQPVQLYLKLLPTFPHGAPEMIVTVISPASTSSGELHELQIETESKARLSWLWSSRLYEIVQDVQDSVQGPNLRLASAPPPLPVPQVIPGAIPVPPAATSIPAMAPSRSPNRPIVLITGLIVIVLMLAGTGIYFAFLRDPCGEQRNTAQRALQSGDPTTMLQAVTLYETMRSRGQAGEGGSCGGLVTDPTPLREAYEQTAAAQFTAGELESAQNLYQQALAIDPQSVSANEGLTKTITARTRPLWSAVESNWSINSEQSWGEVVSSLDAIHSLNPEALNPTNSISVTLQLHDAYIAWGDLTLDSDPQASAEHYAAALALQIDPVLVTERQGWADWAIRLQAADAADVAALISELDQTAGENPDLRDPLGRSIDQWRYLAHVAYGEALVSQGGAVGEEAMAHANAALELVQSAPDSGRAARLLKGKAEELRATASGYKLSANQLDANAWKTLLKERRISASSSGKPVNLLIIAPSANMLITIVGTGNQTQLVTDRTGVAYAALPSGRYVVAISDNPDAGEVSVDLATGATYLVRVTPR